MDDFNKIKVITRQYGVFENGEMIEAFSFPVWYTEEDRLDNIYDDVDVRGRSIEYCGLDVDEIYYLEIRESFDEGAELPLTEEEQMAYLTEEELAEYSAMKGKTK